MMWKGKTREIVKTGKPGGSRYYLKDMQSCELGT